MLANIWFYLAFSTLLAHELDAMHKCEWNLLFILRNWSENTARRTFVLAHIPLVAVLLWLIAHPLDNIRFWTMQGMDIFMIVHAGLHFRLEKHVENRFRTTLSRGLIYGTAILSMIHIVIFWVLR